MINFSYLIILCGSISLSMGQDLIGDYYWRDFNGSIPKDAYKPDGSENSLYVGQGLTKIGDLLIGGLQEDIRRLNVTNGSTVLTLDSAIKILCTRNSSNFVWISNRKSMDRLSGARVYGGSITLGSDYPYGNLIVGRTVDKQLIGYHDTLGVEELNYVDERGQIVGVTDHFEDLYYIF